MIGDMNNGEVPEEVIDLLLQVYLGGYVSAAATAHGHFAETPTSSEQDAEFAMRLARVAILKDPEEMVALRRDLAMVAAGKTPPDRYKYAKYRKGDL